MKFDVFLVGEAEPFEPTHFFRAIAPPRQPEQAKDEPANCQILELDDEIYDPTAMIVGIVKNVSMTNYAERFEFGGLCCHPQMMAVAIFGDDHDPVYYYGAIRKIQVYMEVRQDLRSLHGGDAERQLREITLLEIDKWFLQL
jgi:hypothetical protein